MRTRLAAGLAVVTLTAVLPGGPAAAAGAPTSAGNGPTLDASGPKWTAAPPAPLPDGAIAGVMEDVTVVSPTDVWAVGGWANTDQHPMIVHWDGSAWTRVAVPDPVGSTGVHRLAAVDGLSADEVWAVGAAPSEAGEAAAALRYDGIAWRTASVPPTSTGTSTSLSDVDMLESDDGWAVGEVTTGSAPTQPYVLRWRLGGWTVVPAPSSKADARLEAVYAAAADDVWAVGSRQLTSGRHVGLVLHWNGAMWSEVAPPDRGRSDSLVSVVAAGGSVFAVGSSCAIAHPPQCDPLVLRRSEGRWLALPADNETAVLNEVVALSATEVWLIGHAFSPGLPQVDHAEYWDGQRFVTDDTMLTTVLTTVLPGSSLFGKPASAHALAAADVDKASGVIWAVGWSLGPPEQPHAVFRS